MPFSDARVTACAVAACKIKLFRNNFEITSVFYFTCNDVWNWSKIISAAETVLKLFQHYFSDMEHVERYSQATISLWNNFEIILFHI